MAPNASQFKYLLPSTLHEMISIISDHNEWPLVAYSVEKLFSLVRNVD